MTLVVGSGAGGATLAKGLAQRKKSVLVVEAGKDEKNIGDAHRHYDRKKSKEGVIIRQARMAGGSTVVSCGNGVRCLEKELGGFGIDLSK